MRFVIVLVAVALAPVAQAGYPLCSIATSAPPNPTGVYVIYDVWSGGEFWMESNEEPGLQRRTCERDDGTLALPDTRLFTITA